MIKVGKYIFDSEEQAETKIKGLGVDEDNNPTHNHAIVRLGHEVIEEGETDGEGNVIKEPVLSDKYLIDFINLFNFDDYWCYKVTNKQRLVTQEEFLEFKYSGYMFFKKELYDTDTIDEWVNWMIGMGGIQYLTKPVPPFSPNKVIIREEKQDET